jgi:general secretion pathway protein C
MAHSWRISGADLKSAAGGALVKRLAPPAACLGIIIALAYVLARLTWLVYPAPDQSRAPAPAASPTAPAVAANASNPAGLADRVAAAHLFGRANAPARPVKAPETNLNITLHGIIAATDQDESRAIISAGGGSGQAKSYAIGASIPGGASIHDIYADRVILSRHGRLETLRLPKSKNSNGSVIVRAPTAPKSASPGHKSAGRPVRRPPPRLHHAKPALGRLVRPQRAKVDGKVIGYKVYPGANAAAFLAAGLKPGDVVTSVNGKSLTNATNLMVLMKRARSGKPVKLTIKRNVRTRHVTVTLPHRANS